MLSARNEMIAVGVLITYLAFGPSLPLVRDLLSTPVGKALVLAGIVYVYKFVSCSLALLLVVWYVKGNSWEGFTTPTTTVSPTCTCPDGYAYDSVSKECKPTSSMSGSVPVESTPSSSMGASVSTPPPNSAVSTAPMTTPTPTMPPVPPSSSGGVQPSTGVSSTVGSV